MHEQMEQAERFRFLVSWEFDVSLARAMLCEASIEARAASMSVLRAGVVLLGLDESLFGTGLPAPGECVPDWPDRGPKSTVVDTARLRDIPDHAMHEPLLMVMWDWRASAAASDTGRGSRKRIEAIVQPPSPVLIDGNHRLTRRFLQGDEGKVDALVVVEWDHIAQFLSYRGTCLHEARAAEPSGRAPG